MTYALKVIANTLVAKHALRGKDVEVFTFADVDWQGRVFTAQRGRDDGYALMQGMGDWEVYKGVVDDAGTFIADEE